MIFMSQSGLQDPAGYPAWSKWYEEHLHKMLTVPGVTSAQRFLNERLAYPPSLALYSFASRAVFTEPQYQRVRGLGEWGDLIDRRHYHRNLFEGLDDAPPVAAQQALLVADRVEPDSALPVPMIWLKAVEVDLSTAYRGIAVVEAQDLGRFAEHELGIYLPGTPVLRRTPAAAPAGEEGGHD